MQLRHRVSWLSLTLLLVTTTQLLVKEVAADLENVARGKPATQSSTSYGASGRAENAVDGNRYGIWRAFNNSITHTWLYGETDPYWEVDLQGNFSVAAVHIYNRINTCCEHRISGAVLELYEDGNEDPVGTGLIEDIGDHDFFAPTPEGSYFFPFTFPLVNTNRVKIHIPGDEEHLKVLSLAEVEVWAIPTPPSTPPPEEPPEFIVEVSSEEPTTSPTEPPSTAPPSLAPSESPTDTCSDLENAFFLSNLDGQRRDCAWLEAQTADIIAEECDSDNNAYHICHHTCDACDTRRANPEATSGDIVGCEDLYDVFFPMTNGSGRYKDCIWLSSRRNQINQYCVPSNPAYHICEDTCNKCSDICKDRPGALPEYIADPSQQLIGTAKTCAQLADIPRDIPLACSIPEISDKCQDVCDSCVIPSTAPSEPPSELSSTVEPQENIIVESESPSDAPSEPPMVDCDDDPVSEFMVLHYKMKDCAWLEGHLLSSIASTNEFSSIPQSVLQANYGHNSVADFGTTTFGDVLCVSGQAAYDMCEETCGKCSDNCFDDDTEEFMTQGHGLQRCPWLRAKPLPMINLHCNFGPDAARLCQETCGSCR